MQFATGTLHLASQANAIVLPIIHLYRPRKNLRGPGEPLDGQWKNGPDDYRRILEAFVKTPGDLYHSAPEEYMGMYGHTVFECLLQELQGANPRTG